MGGLPLASFDAPHTVYSQPTLESLPCKWYQWIDGDEHLTEWKTFLHQDSSGYGPEMSCMTLLRAAHPEWSLGALKSAAGGSNNKDWWGSEGGEGWAGARLLGVIDEAITLLEGEDDDYEFSGLFVLQGETLAQSIEYQLNNPSVGDQYITDWLSGIAQIRTATSTPNLPVIFGKIGDHMISDWYIENAFLPFNVGATAQDAIDCLERRWYHQQQVVDGAGNAVLVSMDGIPNREEGVDAIHWPDDGYLAAGERFGNSFLDFISPQPRRVLRLSTASGRCAISVGGA